MCIHSSIFIIIVITVVGFYFIVGALIMKFKFNRNGLDICPHKGHFILSRFTLHDDKSLITRHWRIIFICSLSAWCMGEPCAFCRILVESGLSLQGWGSFYSNGFRFVQQVRTIPASSCQDIFDSIWNLSRCIEPIGLIERPLGFIGTKLGT